MVKVRVLLVSLRRTHDVAGACRLAMAEVPVQLRLGALATVPDSRSLQTLLNGRATASGLYVRVRIPWLPPTLWRLARPSAFGMWESLAIRRYGVPESAGSNPAIPTDFLPRSTTVVRLAVNQRGVGSSPTGAAHIQGRAPGRAVRLQPAQRGFDSFRPCCVSVAEQPRHRPAASDRRVRLPPDTFLYAL